MGKPRLIRTYLPDGTLEGVKIIELSESSIKAFVTPRIKINQLKDRKEMQQPAIYMLINSGENQLYIGECENFFHRIKTQDQSKNFWDIALAIVSSTNSLEKSDVKYLESLAVEKAKDTAAMEVMNKVIPARNTIHEFKIHSLQVVLDDIATVVESLGFSIFTSSSNKQETIWHIKSKKTDAKAQYRGDKFILLAGSVIDKSRTDSWAKGYSSEEKRREELFAKYGIDRGETVEITENIPFRSPSQAGGFATGRNNNGWLTWKNAHLKTMDEVIRKGSA